MRADPGRSVPGHNDVKGDRHEPQRATVFASRDRPETLAAAGGKSPSRLPPLAVHPKFHRVPIQSIRAAYRGFPAQNDSGKLVTVEREREFQRRYVFPPPSRPTARGRLAPDHWLRPLTPAHVDRASARSA